MGSDFTETDSGLTLKVAGIMRHSKHDDAELAEVKEILGRLQRISRKPREGRAQTDGGDLAAPSSLRRGMPGSRFSVTGHVRLVTAAVLVVLLAAAGAGVVIFAGPGRKSDAVVVKERRADAVPRDLVAPGTPAREAQNPVARNASDLMASGQVKAARAALLGAAQDDSADVAFALALSYDPHYLATIAGADAGPDVAEAKRWYRTWYNIAVRQGLVSNGLPLARIMRSMN